MTERSPTVTFGDDGSPAADVCWLWLNSHHWPGWRLEVITAQPPPLGPPPDPEAATLRPWTPPEPRVVFAEAGFAEVEYLTAELDPRLALCRPVELLVVGPRGPGLLKALSIGSTTEWLLHHPPAPLVIVRAGHRTRTVLACHDGSPHASLAFATLGRLPWLDDVELTVVVVDDGRTDVDEAAATAMAELGPDRGAEVVRLKGRPRDTIIDAVARRRPDLVALGTRGLTGVHRIHAGTTAAAVAHTAPGSVLVAYADQS